MTTTQDSTDKRVVACNYRVPTKDAAQGALCYVLDPNYGNGCERVRLLVRSRGARWIDRWEDSRRLTNFRVKTVPPAHGRYGDLWEWLPPEYVSEEDTLARLRRASERQGSRLSAAGSRPSGGG